MRPMSSNRTSRHDTLDDAGEDSAEESSMDRLMSGLNDVRQMGLNTVKVMQPGAGRSGIRLRVDSEHKKKLKKESSFGLEVVEVVSPEMRLAIWNNEYIAFVDLLYPDHKGKMDVAYTGGRSMTLTERRPKEIKDILEWMEAFEIYSHFSQKGCEKVQSS